MLTKRTLYPIAVVSAGVMMLLSGCAGMTAAQKGALGGGAIGAVAGQIIGGDTEATLLGAGIGALTGAIANDYVDQQKEDAYHQGARDASVQQTYTTPPPPTAEPRVYKTETKTTTEYYYSTSPR